MDKRFIVSTSPSQEEQKSFSEENFYFKFGGVPFDILFDVLFDLDRKNKYKLEKISNYCGSFKESRLLECVFLVCEELKLNPFVGYQAIEILERFMIKHLVDQFCSKSSAGAEGGGWNVENAVFTKLREKINVFVLSCVQLASKLAQQIQVGIQVVDNNMAVKFFHSMGQSCTKESLLQSELLILKTLDFCINFPNPLTYVETLLEALEYNSQSISTLHLYFLCLRVLQFVYLHRHTIYYSLLVATTECSSPSPEQRMKFVSVKEDYMFLGVGIIAVSAFILNFATWEKTNSGLQEAWRLGNTNANTRCTFDMPPV